MRFTGSRYFALKTLFIMVLILELCTKILGENQTTGYPSATPSKESGTLYSGKPYILTKMSSSPMPVGVISENVLTSKVQESGFGSSGYKIASSKVMLETKSVKMDKSRSIHLNNPSRVIAQPKPGTSDATRFSNVPQADVKLSASLSGLYSKISTQEDSSPAKSNGLETSSQPRKSLEPSPLNTMKMATPSKIERASPTVRKGLGSKMEHTYNEVKSTSVLRKIVVGSSLAIMNNESVITTIKVSHSETQRSASVSENKGIFLNRSSLNSNVENNFRSTKDFEPKVTNTNIIQNIEATTMSKFTASKSPILSHDNTTDKLPVKSVIPVLPDINMTKSYTAFPPSSPVPTDSFNAHKTITNAISSSIHLLYSSYSVQQHTSKISKSRHVIRATHISPSLSTNDYSTSYSTKTPNLIPEYHSGQLPKNTSEVITYFATPAITPHGATNLTLATTVYHSIPIQIPFLPTNITTKAFEPNQTTKLDRTVLVQPSLPLISHTVIKATLKNTSFFLRPSQVPTNSTKALAVSLKTSSVIKGTMVPNISLFNHSAHLNITLFPSNTVDKTTLFTTSTHENYTTAILNTTFVIPVFIKPSININKTTITSSLLQSRNISMVHGFEPSLINRTSLSPSLFPSRIENTSSLFPSSSYKNMSRSSNETVVAPVKPMDINRTIATPLPSRIGNVSSLTPGGHVINMSSSVMVMSNKTIIPAVRPLNISKTIGSIVSSTSAYSNLTSSMMVLSNKTVVPFIKPSFNTNKTMVNQYVNSSVSVTSVSPNMTVYGMPSNHSMVPVVKKSINLLNITESIVENGTTSIYLYQNFSTTVMVAPNKTMVPVGTSLKINKTVVSSSLVTSHIENGTTLYPTGSSGNVTSTIVVFLNQTVAAGTMTPQLSINRTITSSVLVSRIQNGSIFSSTRIPENVSSTEAGPLNQTLIPIIVQPSLKLNRTTIRPSATMLGNGTSLIPSKSYEMVNSTARVSLNQTVVPVIIKPSLDVNKTMTTSSLFPSKVSSISPTRSYHIVNGTVGVTSNQTIIPIMLKPSVNISRPTTSSSLLPSKVGNISRLSPTRTYEIINSTAVMISNKTALPVMQPSFSITRSSVSSYPYLSYAINVSSSRFIAQVLSTVSTTSLKKVKTSLTTDLVMSSVHKTSQSTFTSNTTTVIIHHAASPSLKASVVIFTKPVLPPSEIKEQEFMLTLQIVSEQFTEALSRRSSVEFKEKSNEIEQELDMVYKDMEEYSYCEVKKFSEGSLVCDVAIYTQSSTELSDRDVKEPIVEAKNSGTFGDYVVEDIEVKEVKPETEVKQVESNDGVTWGKWPVIVISILGGICFLLLVIVISQCIQGRHYSHSISEPSPIPQHSPLVQLKPTRESYATDEERVPMTTFNHSNV